MMVCGKKIVVERAGRVGELSLTGYSPKQCWHYIEPATLSHALLTPISVPLDSLELDSDQTDKLTSAMLAPSPPGTVVRSARRPTKRRSRGAAWPASKGQGAFVPTPERYIEPLNKLCSLLLVLDARRRPWRCGRRAFADISDIDLEW